MRWLARVRDIGRYTWFDLVSMPPARWLLMLAIPVMILVMVLFLLLPAVWAMERSESDTSDPEFAVVSADLALGAEVVGWFQAELDLVAVAVPTRESVPAGMTEVVLGSDFAQDAAAEVIEDGEPADASWLILSTLRNGVIDRKVTAAVGPAPAVVVVRPDGSAVEPKLEAAAPWVEVLDPAAGMSPARVGAVLIFLGALMGVGIGGAVSLSERHGFNQVLGVGTERVVIYLSELLTGSIFLGGQILGLFVVYAGLVWAVSLTAPELGGAAGVVLLTGPVVAALMAVALVHSAALGCFLERMARDAPAQLRERLVQVAAMGVGGLMLFVEDVPEWLIAAACFAPGVGPAALMWQAPGPGLSVAALGVQVGWTIACVWLGSFVFSLDETPVSFVRRRWAPTAAS